MRDIISSIYSSSLMFFCKRAWIIISVLIIVSFLFSPKAPVNECRIKYLFFSYIELNHSCDSTNIERYIQNDISQYFNNFHNWKGRPVYFLMGVALTPLASVVEGFIKSSIINNHVVKTIMNGNEIVGTYTLGLKYLSVQLAYFFINIIFVVSFIWMSIRIIGLSTNAILSITLAMALASFEIVESGVWLLHSVIFNFCAIIAFIWYFMLGFQSKFSTRSLLYGQFILAGLGVLIYPIFILCLPSYLAGVGYSIFQKETVFRKTSANVQNVIMAIFLMLIPVVMWNIISTLIFNTDVYMTATKFKQFVWIIDGMKESDFHEVLYSKAVDYMKLQASFLFPLIFYFLSFLFSFLVMGFLKPNQLFDAVLVACFVAVIGIYIFNFLQGYHPPRLTYGVLLASYIFVARVGVLAGKQIFTSITLFILSMTQLFIAFTGPTIIV